LKKTTVNDGAFSKKRIAFFGHPDKTRGFSEKSAAVSTTDRNTSVVAKRVAAGSRDSVLRELVKKTLSEPRQYATSGQAKRRPWKQTYSNVSNTCVVLEKFFGVAALRRESMQTHARRRRKPPARRV